ncbi:MAG: glycine cleavage system protein GcvH [Muribaculaceae bacterium]|nr:glycine cleavage system protein GcvH [Muribaculaceae bacterium]
MSKVLADRRYADSHEWVKLDGDIATVGISDYAQHAMGDITYVDMPETGDEVSKGEDFGAVESVKAASDLISPVSGEVIEVNEELEDQPELLNEDPYANWIIKVKVSDPSEIDSLMDAEEYKKICEE